MNIARKQDCTGCMACVDSCSRSALVPQVDLYGYYEILFDSTKCISCGLCTKTCPVVTKVSNITKKSTPYAVWNNNKELRGALKEVCIRCEGQLKKETINADCLRLAVDILQICRQGGM